MNYFIGILCLFFGSIASGQNTLSVSFSKTDEHCAKGSAAVSVDSGTNTAHISWSTGDTNKVVSNLAAGNYSVKVSTEQSDTTISFMIAHVDCEVGIPNHFTPNDDGYNDTWNITGVPFYPSFELVVFNRWGQQVHHQSGQYTPWDGRSLGISLPDGTYYYVFYFDKKEKHNILKGDVTILR